MYAHKTKVLVTESHELRGVLPHDFPSGEAELILIAESTSTATTRGGDCERAAGDFQQWLDGLLARLPAVPELPAESFDRSSLYDE